MTEFTTVAKVGAIPEGEGRSFSVAGRMVGIFLLHGEYFAINDLCLHMGASLAGGYIENHSVTCPWHAWRFSVKDGTWLDNPRVKTDAYPVRLEDDKIQVQVPPREEPPPAESGETSADSESPTCQANDQAAADSTTDSNNQSPPCGDNECK
jgi:nitrite reductase (NADH) small subunit/3-phenylpropionate/trans-cinnamate dioxygenase ferredoxin subunit